MKFYLSTFLLAGFLLSSQPVQAGSWAENIIDWFSGLFSSEETSATTYSQAEIDSLSVTPTGLLLNIVPESDTLATDFNWPYESLTVSTDLERHHRLLRETVVLTNPIDKLPLTGTPAIRVLYRSDQRPARFLDLARRFADVQEVAYDELVARVLPAASDLPTIIMADDPIGLSSANADWYSELYPIGLRNVTMIHFGDPALLTGLPEEWTLINSPLRCKESEAFLAQAVFGAELLDGRLSESTTAFRAGTGYRLDAVTSGFALPELLGIDREKFDHIDYQINRGIRYRAMPGAELLVMKDGKVVYEKAYGHHTYRRQKVNTGDLYDLASITKAAATSFAVMKLYDEGKIALDARVKDYLPEFKRRTIGRYKIEQLLTHHSGLQSDLPLNGLIGRQFVADSIRDDFQLAIGPDRWLDTKVPGLVRKGLSGKIGYTRRLMYRYSDLNYYLLQLIVEELAEEPMEDLLEREFYKPMRLGRLRFNPVASGVPSKVVVPTVVDSWMRGGLLRGYVHDEGAALLGGVAGHAGLFGNAHDLARLFQLLNDGGAFEGEELLTPETVNLFTSRGRYNYRALGFDRLAGGWGNVVSAGASNKTFGHLGFSGTSVWADPENGLVFVLLTNRVHPDPKNERFMSMNIRGKVYRGIYRALNSWEMDS